MKLSKLVEEIERELQKPLPSPRIEHKPRRVKRKKRKEKSEMAKKKVSKKKLSAKEEKSTKKSKKVSNGSEDGYVTVADLAEEAGIGPQAARVKLREAEVPRDGEARWRWKEGSKSLKAARKALGI